MARVLHVWEHKSSGIHWQGTAEMYTPVYTALCGLNTPEPDSEGYYETTTCQTCAFIYRLVAPEKL